MSGGGPHPGFARPGLDLWIDRFRRSLTASCNLRRARRLLVGVSGGPDSTALLCLLVELRDSVAPHPFPLVMAGHVHHGLRGAEADEDEAFVRRLAGDRGVEILVARGDAGAEGRRGRLSPEAAARSLRLRLFRAWAEERDLDAILLAHHLDDQAETVLLRAIRGAGVAGLGGIPRSRLLAGKGTRTRVIRPLLGWTRADILRYLKDRGRPYRLDSTNEDPTVPRNLLRREVLPVLESRVQAGAIRSLARLGRIAAGVARDVRELAVRGLREGRVPGPESTVCLSAEALRAWPPIVLREVLVLALGDLAPPDGGPIAPPRSASRAFASWTQEGAPPEALFEFGPKAGDARHRLELRYGTIRISRAPISRAAISSAAISNAAVGEGAPLDGISRDGGAQPAALGLPVPGAVRWGGWRIEAVEAPRRAPEVGNATGGGSFVEVVDAARVAEAGPLGVRSRLRGERFRPLGAPGEKALGEFLRERRVWPSERDRVPIVAAGSAIVWVVGHRIDERFRVTDTTADVLVLRAGRRP